MGTLHPEQDAPALATGATQDDAGLPGLCVMSCETLAGDAVLSKAGEELGTLEHIMIDVPSGRIAYAVLGCGGVFGIGERLYAIPWSELTLDAERECFVLDISPERLDTEIARIL